MSVVGEIVRTTFRQELRMPRGSTGARGRRGGLIGSLAVFVFSGFITAASIARGVDHFTAGMLSSTVFMLLFAIFVVMEFAVIVTGPDDLAFYLPLPVPARAYVSAKIAVVLLFGCAFTVAFALPPLLILGLTGAGVTFVAEELLILVDAALFAGLAIVALLGVLVRFVSSKRLREVATWAQFVVFIMVYGGFFIAQRSLGGASGIHLGAVPALLFAPSSWAAMPLAHGADAAGLAGAVLAVAVPVVLFVLAVRVIAASYEGKIADAAVVETRTVRATRMAGGGGLLWRSAEEKGMALLIANFFGQDSQFRMGVLTIIPVTVLYVVIILFAHRAPIADPFTQAGRAGFGSTMLLYLAVGFFPTYMKSALTYSGQAEASWIFSVSPANRLLILRAARRFILVFFVTPYMILLGVLHAVLTHAVLHTVQHFAVIAVLVLIEIDVLLLFFPRMPFSRMTAAGRRGAGPLVRMLAGVILLLPLFLMVDFVYPSTVAYWAALAGLCIAMVILRLVGNQHAARRLEAEEFIA